MKEFVEQKILRAVRSLLAGRVNEILGEGDLPIPPVEFGGYGGGAAVIPTINLSTCERTEKERIIRLDAYGLTITFALPELAEGELFCYAYAAAVELALMENPTLDGAADRAVMTGKKYMPPKHEHCGEGWGVVLTVRVTVSVSSEQLAVSSGVVCNGIVECECNEQLAVSNGVVCNFFFIFHVRGMGNSRE